MHALRQRAFGASLPFPASSTGTVAIADVFRIPPRRVDVEVVDDLAVDTRSVLVAIAPFSAADP